MGNTHTPTKCLRKKPKNLSLESIEQWSCGPHEPKRFNSSDSLESSFCHTESQTSSGSLDTIMSPVYRPLKHSHHSQSYSFLDILPGDCIVLINTFLPQPAGFFLLLSVTDRKRELQKYLFENSDTDNVIFPLNASYFRYLDLNVHVSYLWKVKKVSIESHNEEIRKRLKKLPNIKSLYVRGVEMTPRELENYKHLGDSIVPIKFDGKLDLSKQTKKICLLGAGESGKSTFFHHVEMMTNKREDIPNPFISFLNVCTITRETCQLVTRNRIEFDQLLVKKAIAYFIEPRHHDNYFEEVTENMQEAPKIFDQVFLLWTTPKFVEVFNTNRYASNTHDGSRFLISIENLIRYDPKLIRVNHQLFPEDHLHVYTKTSRMKSLSFVHQGHNYQLMTFGGNRSQRRKWIFGLGDSSEILYFASLTDYCRVCFENPSLNRLQDSIDCFDTLATKLVIEKGKHIKLIFTKRDVFEDCLQVKPLKECCPEYNGDSTKDALAYITGRFLRCVQSHLHLVTVSTISTYNTTQTIELLATVL